MSITQEDVQHVQALVKKLEGTTLDFDQVADEELGIETNPAMCAYFDTRLWRCEDCDHWCPTQELKDGLCMGCRTEG